ncbi:thioredoxin-like protein [Triangularia verruculosa]|uniref:Thioredoxin-like protein n=1 Tax=Triangularia verruculosa TaxID=2587418 RepID=A0AAN7AV13_9PEZI|nr:thioredoxin-like protein [Triangularia verruculosa]
MSNPTPAQEEFASFLDKNSRDSLDGIHPEDRASAAREAAEQSEDEEEQYRAQKIDEAMRMPTMDSRTALRLPPTSFDDGHSTGVKGVIADARSYENARQRTWKDKARAVRRSVFGLEGARHSGTDSEGSGPEDADEEEFLNRWRESRKRELEEESRNPVRNRRTSPSVRMYGHLEEVDALGYLDSIEKVGRETVVVVFVYDHQSEVSAAIESALVPLVTTYPTVRFVKVHCEEIEFDNAGVPAVLAYRNQGDLFANLTGILELIPDEDDFDTDALKKIFIKHNIL